VGVMDEGAVGAAPLIGASSSPCHPLYSVVGVHFLAFTGIQNLKD
jgi:hypothetical protein